MVRVAVLPSGVTPEHPGGAARLAEDAAVHRAAEEDHRRRHPGLRAARRGERRGAAASARPTGSCWSRARARPARSSPRAPPRSWSAWAPTTAGVVLNDAREFSIPLGEAAHVPADPEDAEGRRSGAARAERRSSDEPVRMPGSRCPERRSRSPRDVVEEPQRGRGAHVVEEPRAIDDPDGRPSRASGSEPSRLGTAMSAPSDGAERPAAASCTSSARSWRGSSSSCPIVGSGRSSDPDRPSVPATRRRS